MATLIRPFMDRFEHVDDSDPLLIIPMRVPFEKILLEVIPGEGIDICYISDDNLVMREHNARPQQLVWILEQAEALGIKVYNEASLDAPYG